MLNSVVHSISVSAMVQWFSIVLLIALTLVGCQGYDQSMYYADLKVVELGGGITIHVDEKEHLEGLFLRFADSHVRRCSEITPAEVKPYFLEMDINQEPDGTMVYGSATIRCKFTFVNERLESVIVGSAWDFGIGRSQAGPFLQMPIKGSGDPRIIEILGTPLRTESHAKPRV